MSRSLCVILLIGCVLAAGCSGDDSTSDSSSTSAGSTISKTPVETATTILEIVATDVEVATINVLHGLPFASGCGPDTDQCNAPARVDILWDLLETQAGCPEIVALQEISPRQQELVPEKLPELCKGSHVLLVDDLGLPDQEMILTTLPVLGERRVELAGAPTWSAHWAQLDAGDGGIVDVFATHYASSALDLACDDSDALTVCSEVCPAGSNFGRCHPHETLAFLEDNASDGSLQLIVGDLNKEIADTRIMTLLDAGFVDTYLDAGNPECVRAGEGCTSGIGGDTDYDGLDIADQTLRSRIDFVLARPTAGCALLVETGDADHDGTSTGHWANTPLSRPVDGLYWAADHVGVQADVGMRC